MKKAILATKVGMTQIFDENGVLVPVTVLQAGPCVVTQVKTADNDGLDVGSAGERVVQQRADERELDHAFQEAAAFIRDFVELGKVGRVDHHDSAEAFRGCIAGGYDERAG